MSFVEIIIQKYSFLETIVGVNKYKLEKEIPIEVLSIDNSKVIEVQKGKLERLYASRDKKGVEEALNSLTECAASGGVCVCMCVFVCAHV